MRRVLALPAALLAALVVAAPATGASSSVDDIAAAYPV